MFEEAMFENETEDEEEDEKYTFGSSDVKEKHRMGNNFKSNLIGIGIYVVVIIFVFMTCMFISVCIFYKCCRKRNG